MKKSWLTGVVLALFLMGGWQFARRYFSSGPLADSQQAGTGEVAQPNPAAADQAEKRVMQTRRDPLPVAPTPNVSEECVRFFNDLRGVELADAIEFPPKAELFPKGDGCGNSLPGFEKADAAYRESCVALFQNRELSKEEYQQKLPQCQMAFFQYRAKLTDWLTRDMKLEDIKDPRILADKLMARIVDNPSGAADVAERLMQLEPNFYPAAKAALLSRFMDAQTPNRAQDNDKYSRVDSLLKRAGDLNPKDQRDLFELEMVSLKSRGDTSGRTEARAKDFMEAHPDKGLGPYYLAWNEFQKGNRSESVRLLNEAIRREPGEARFHEALEKVQQGATQDAFQMKADLNWDPQGFFKK